MHAPRLSATPCGGHNRREPTRTALAFLMTPPTRPVDPHEEFSCPPAPSRPHPPCPSGWRPGRRRPTRCARRASSLNGPRRRGRRARRRTACCSDLAWVPEQDTDVEAVPASSPDGLAVLRHSTAHVMAQAVQDLFPGTLLGIGPPIEDGFYYDFLPRRPFTPDDLAAIEKKMNDIVKAGPAVLAPSDRRRGRAQGTGAREVQARTDRVEVDRDRGGGHRGRCRRADHVRQPRRQYRRAGLDRPVPRAAPADHQAHPRVQADAQRGGVLARQREEPAAAAHLRHRVGLARRPQGPPAPARGGRQARPPQARRRTRPVQLSGRDRVRPAGVPSEGRRAQARTGGLRAPAAHRGGLRVRRHPAHLARRGCSTPPGTCRTTPTPCSRRWRSTTARCTSRR